MLLLINLRCIKDWVHQILPTQHNRVKRSRGRLQIKKRYLGDRVWAVTITIGQKRLLGLHLGSRSLVKDPGISDEEI